MEEYLTFDDVLLLPQESSVLPSQIDTTSRLVKTFFLKSFFIRCNGYVIEYKWQSYG